VAASLEQARGAKQKVLELLSRNGNVVGVGITRVADNSFAVKVNLKGHPERDNDLPREMDGVPVVLEVTGVPQKRSNAP
jgi:hypothetical protein